MGETRGPGRGCVRAEITCLQRFKAPVCGAEGFSGSVL